MWLCAQVIRTLEEPTAAALAFGLHRKPNVNHILVYDLGGGTLDVSLLFVNDGSVEVLGSDGDDNLGGKLRRSVVIAQATAPSYATCSLRNTTCGGFVLVALDSTLCVVWGNIPRFAAGIPSLSPLPF